MIQTPPRQRLLTVDDLDAMPEDGILRELVHGELREWMTPAADHAKIETKLGRSLDEFVEEGDLGDVLTGEVRFFIRGDSRRVRLADVAFVARGKYREGMTPQELAAVEPDFVAEIISPDDQADLVQEKVTDWLEAGARLVWLIYPRQRQVVVHRPDATSRTFGYNDTLDGGDVFPGLSLPVKTVLRRLHTH